jgi:hypothetical protein
MLSREEAQKRLDAFRRPDGQSDAGLGGQAVGQNLAVMLALPGLDDGSLLGAAAALDGMDGRTRQAALDGVVAGLGCELDWMWEAGTALPYQVGVERRAFRAVGVPEFSRLARAQRLAEVARAVHPFRPEGPVWLAHWAPHLLGAPSGVGPLLASVIDRGGQVGDAVFEVLVASAEGEDEVGSMGRHVVSGLLGSAREDGWSYIERLLLAAQRQEGLRQVVLASVDEGHPEAFRRMLSVILEHGLLRFSVAARAVSVWFGLPHAAGDVKRLEGLLASAVRYLADPAGVAAAVSDAEAQEAYVALCAAAWSDAPGACAMAVSALTGPVSLERRFALLYFLAQVRIPPAATALSEALAHDDLRIAVMGLRGLSWHESAPAGTIDHIDRLVDRVGDRTRVLKRLVWPGTEGTIKAAEPAGELLRRLRDSEVERVIRHLPVMDSAHRLEVAKALGSSSSWSPVSRGAILKLVGDRSPSVREAAIVTAQMMEPTDEDVVALEQLLSRKAADLRRGVIALLRARGPERALASADRLLAERDPQQRLAGLELLRQLAEDGVPAAEDRVRRHGVEHPEATDEVAGAVSQIKAVAWMGRATLDNAFGLLDRNGLTKSRPLVSRDVAFATTEATSCVVSLDQLVESYKQTEVEVETQDGYPKRNLLSNLEPVIGLRAAVRTTMLDLTNEGLAPRETLSELLRRRLPLIDVWRKWEQARQRDQRDPDGLELVRALLVPTSGSQKSQRLGLSEPVCSELSNLRVLRVSHASIVQAILHWLVMLTSPPGTAEYLLDSAELLLHSVPIEDLYVTALPQGRLQHAAWRNAGWLLGLQVARSHRHLRPDQWTAAQQRRLWELEVWAENPTGPGVDPDRVEMIRAPPGELVSAFKAGAATDADVIARVLGPDSRPLAYYRSGHSFSALRVLCGQSLPDRFGDPPGLLDIIHRCGERIIEVELNRGEAPTEATGAAMVMRYSGGLNALVPLLQGLGRETFLRGWSWQDSQSRTASFSHLIRASSPRGQDTYAAFAERIKAIQLTEKRLMELAAYAPQWSGHVEATLGICGLADGVWWFHAHTKDDSWSVDRELRDVWSAEVAERTPLTDRELLDGACDVDWFLRAHAALGPERWKQLDAAAKYCSSAGGHTRAQLFARSMEGAVDAQALTARIDQKRHRDSVRALGLVPLLSAGPDREGALLQRYEAIQEFARTSRQFGSQRQASERRAAEMALANLARTAGYRDPLRLEWAMEASSVADLAGRPAVAEVQDVRVTLTIDPDGAPLLTVARGDKALKSVPAKLTKNAEISALRTRVTDLRRQRGRMRASLEQMMIRGDAFSGDELHRLLTHPMLFPLLGRLVLIGEGTHGYPTVDGRRLINPANCSQAIGHSELLRIAHPTDLLDAGDWPAWQRDCLTRHRAQPFKQVFRELYLLTNGERAERDHSTRYAGQVIQPRAALSLLAGRGWIAHPEAGVRRPFHDAGLSASLTFLGGVIAPADVEAPTIDKIRFTHIGDDNAVPLATVPPRIFSEVMRDLDLVVSVAHVGAVDPEASASTVQMRAALVEQTTRQLSIDNVRIESARALITGRLGDYSVHLGSATVHRQPGGSICIVPVHERHRGRLFLPFIDDDPKTAEVMSKVLLLARDHEIRDPLILEQIQGP